MFACPLRLIQIAHACLVRVTKVVFACLLYKSTPCLPSTFHAAESVQTWCFGCWLVMLLLLHDCLQECLRRCR